MKIDKTHILSQLKELKKFRSDAEFARYLGISSSRLGKWYERNTFNIEIVSIKFPEVENVWLLTGEGNMLKEEINQKNENIKDEVIQPSNPVTMSREVFDLISSQQKTIQMQQETIRYLSIQIKKEDANTDTADVKIG